MCLKLDISKAFDSVNWNYLLEAMKQLGFSQTWCNLIREMLRATFQVKVNGFLSPSYEAANGLRQGDPLSPYLFVIAMEGFSRLMDLSVKKQWISPLRRRSTSISHTLYADDVMVYAHATTTSARGIAKVLERFAAYSGLVPNLQKCSVFFGGPSVNEDELLAILGMVKGQLPSTYLGLPLITTALNAQLCNPLVEKIKMKLTGWAGKLLSFAGRTELIRSVITSMHLYWSSCFQLPEATLSTIEAHFRNFLWQNKAPMVKWEDCCLPKREGGLGFKCIRGMNLVAVVRLIWKIFKESDSTWTRWLTAKYLDGNVENFWTVDKHKAPSWVWRSMWNARDKGRQLILGNSWLGRVHSFTFTSAYDTIRRTRPMETWYKEV